MRTAIFPERVLLRLPAGTTDRVRRAAVEDQTTCAEVLRAMIRVGLGLGNGQGKRTRPARRP